MGTVTVRNLDDQTKQALRHRAVRHGVSMEQELRTILTDAAKAEAGHLSPARKEESLYDAIRRLVEPYGGFELEIPERQPAREPPTFR
jgi:plasmid stability protein